MICLFDSRVDAQADGMAIGLSAVYRSSSAALIGEPSTWGNPSTRPLAEGAFLT
jgi:hypothetical protein